MLMPMQPVRESLDEIGINAQVKLTVELHVLFDSAFKRPSMEVRVSGLAIQSDWNVGVCALEIDVTAGGILRLIVLLV